MVLRPILRSIQRKILRPIFAAAQRIFITVNGVDGYFAVQNPVTFAEDFELELELFMSSLPSTTEAMFATSIDTDDFLGILMTGAIRFNVNGSSVDYSTNLLSINKLNRIKFSRVGAIGTVNVNGATQSETVGTDAFTIDTIMAFLSLSRFTDGTPANPKLTDLTTPSNSESWQLNRLTANTEQSSSGNNLLTYVDIPTGAPDRELFTLNTVTDPDQWENADKSRIIQIA